MSKRDKSQGVSLDPVLHRDIKEFCEKNGIVIKAFAHRWLRHGLEFEKSRMEKFNRDRSELTAV